MIPLKLELTNFLSYRDTAVLDFSAIHLACISGANGAGKSSILDGITWALFGQARSKNDDDLVNRIAALESKTAEVRFTFALENNIYRVIRRKPLKKSMSLEFQIAVEEGRWKPLSEGKLRETQVAIETLLRMNYDTFINASFLLQGKADEFTTKTPNRRKEILADLLGVSRWDVYKEAATARRKEEEGRLAFLDVQLDETSRELAQEPERAEALKAAEAERLLMVERLGDKEKLLEQLRRAETAVQQQKQMVKSQAANLARAQQELANRQKSHQQRQQERASYQEILNQTAQIMADFIAWQEAETRLQEWQSKADEFNKLQQAKRPFELTITQERTRLEQRGRELEAQAQKVAGAIAERITASQNLADGQAAIAQLTAQLNDLATQEEEWHTARAELAQLEVERQGWEKERSQLQARARQIQMMQEERTAVAKNLQEATELYTQLTAELAALTERSQRHAIAQADIKNLQEENGRLKEQMNKWRERVDRLEAEAGGECPLCGQSMSETHRQSVITQLKTEGKEWADRYRANQKQIETLTAEVAQLEAVIKQTPKLERDQQAQTQRLAKAEERLTAIDQAIIEWETEGRGRLGELEQWLADDSAASAAKQKVITLGTAVQAKNKLEKEKQTQERQVAAAEARLGEVDRLVAEWEKEGKTALAEVKQRLGIGDYAQEAQAALADLMMQITQVGYEAAAHEAARAARNALPHARDRHQKLKEAEAAVKPLDSALADLEKQIAAQTQMVADLTAEHQTAVIQLETLSIGTGELRTVENEVFRLREEKTLVEQRVGAARQKLEVLDDLRTRQKQLDQERAALTQRIQRLKLLEKACGREGVQALLIEQTLPEIEERANELLYRLTGGDMRVSFETQKQLKSREALAETLDIRIVDGVGERPYDNFSGGEQFRINFAIRLALSQLLAKRAGARLQTLVIDEGFGSQDPHGRQRLIEAIHTIQDDFTRILVITHIDELRDAFPARIEIEKRPSGSVITVQ